MRAIIATLAALGVGAILATGVVSVTTGNAPELYWLIVGPLPFLVLGVAGFLRQPENRMVWWLVGVGAAFACETALGDVFLPMAENHWGVTSSVTAVIALLEHWSAVAGPLMVSVEAANIATRAAPNLDLAVTVLPMSQWATSVTLPP